MNGQKIYVIGSDDTVILFGLIGIKGTVVKDPPELLAMFKELVKNPSLGMIIITLDLPQNIIEYLIEFKINNKRPFVYYLPNIFQPNIEKNDLFLNQIVKSIKKIIA